MSRGPGRLQTAILDELRKATGTRLPWTDLKRTFPNEAAQHSLQRAVRSLRKRGLVFDQYAGDRRCVALTVLGDTELRNLCSAAHAQLSAVAKVRGLAVPSLVEPALSEPKPRPSQLEVDT